MTVGELILRLQEEFAPDLPVAVLWDAGFDEDFIVSLMSAGDGSVYATLDVGTDRDWRS